MIGTLGSVASLLAVTLYQGHHDRKHIIPSLLFTMLYLSYVRGIWIWSKHLVQLILCAVDVAFIHCSTSCSLHQLMWRLYIVPHLVHFTSWCGVYTLFHILFTSSVDVAFIHCSTSCSLHHVVRLSSIFKWLSPYIETFFTVIRIRNQNQTNLLYFILSRIDVIILL
jgi:hypothetical protein